MDLLKTAFPKFISVLTITRNHFADEYFSGLLTAAIQWDIPEALQISVLMKGLCSSLLTLVTPKNPQSMKEM